MFHFEQDDMMIDDVYLLDVYSTVFVWIGTQANEEEKLKSTEFAVEYVEMAATTDGRDKDTTIVRILAGSEPPMCTWRVSSVISYFDVTSYPVVSQLGFYFGERPLSEET